MKKILITIIIAGAILLAAAYVFLDTRDEQHETTPTVVEDKSAKPSMPSPGRSLSEVEPVRTKLEGTDDYGLLVATAMPLGEGGDKESAELVARVLEYCSFYSQSPEKFTSHVESLASASLDQRQAAALRSLGSRMAERCSNVMPGTSIGTPDIQQWQQKAAELGSIRSLVRTAVTDNQAVTNEDKKQILEAAVASGDPDALLEAAELLRFAPDAGIEGFPAHGSELDQYAWQIAACKLGADCGRGGLFMDQLCLSGLGCGANSYEELVRSQYVPQGGTALLDKKVRAALAYFSDSRSR